MRIHEHMMLDDLAQRMGQDATREQARDLRAILIREGYAGADTSDVPPDDWRIALIEATAAWESI